MSRYFRRTPRGYDGTENTSHKIEDLLPSALKNVTKACRDRPDLILAAWPEIIGPRIAPMAEAVSFRDGILFVKVKNSLIHSLLSQNDKATVLKELRGRFPNVTIKTIVFRMG